eukprot:Gregarina_sp_Poly_1__6514@NODE_3491_length_1059_cov_2125_025202_g2214_i0_p1_GENE_NODE_3491_length_1059_cov_2125_025202_g2214_i0NODE_3491_length_1059_cov_2125_025202_g2214_i0_p1_ORF_typecomplete_len246_score25_60_NODE_3491_length_1059_cov_2125_025202_g2214_i0170907
MRGIVVAILTSLIASGRVLNVEIDYCSAKCEPICQECSQSSTRDILQCLDTNLLAGCESRSILTESWNVTHYCVATDSVVGGWGFITPVLRDLTPAQILSVDLATELVPTTGPYDVLQSDSLPVSILLEQDASSTVEESMLRTCAIERYNGVKATLTNKLSAVSCEDGSEPDPVKGCEYQGHDVAVHYEGGFPGSTPITKSQVLFGVLADSAALANSGSLPPAMENAQFTVVHWVQSVGPSESSA